MVAPSTNPANDARPRDEIDPRQAAWLGLLLFLVILERSLAGASSGVALDVDVVNLAQGMDRFDPGRFSPQPPGYLVYVLIARAVRAVTGFGSLEALQVAARGFVLMSVSATFLAARRLIPGRPFLALGAGALVGLHPIVLFHGVDAQTHGAEAFGVALVALATRLVCEAPRVGRACALGVALAFAASLRPTAAIPALGLVFASLGAHRRAMAQSFGIAGVACLAWFLPTIEAAGGFARYVLASRSLVEGSFASKTSLFSGSRVEGLVALHFSRFSTYALHLVVPFVVGALAAGRGEASSSRVPAAAALFPTLAFYALTFCTEPGYLEGLVPVLALVLVERLAPLGGGRPTRAVALSLVASLVAFALPAGRAYRVPTFDELVGAEVGAHAYLADARASAPGEGRSLLVSDELLRAPMRQLPSLDGRFDLLWIASEREPVFDTTTLTLFGPGGVRPFPGDVVQAPGRPGTLDLRGRYRALVLDPLASVAQQRELAAATACDVGDGDRFVALAIAQCFPTGVLRIGPHTVLVGPR